MTISVPSFDHDDDHRLIQKLLATCVIAAAATQTFVLEDLLRLSDTLTNHDGSNPSPSTPAEVKAFLASRIEALLKISVKGTFQHRAVNAKDLVTQADMAVQKGVVHLLHLWWAQPDSRQSGTAAQPFASSSWMPFAIIGEEDDDEEAGDEESTTSASPAGGGGGEQGTEARKKKNAMLSSVETHALHFIQRALTYLTTAKAAAEAPPRGNQLRGDCTRDASTSLCALLLHMYSSVTTAEQFLAELYEKLVDHQQTRDHHHHHRHPGQSSTQKEGNHHSTRSSLLRVSSSRRQQQQQDSSSSSINNDTSYKNDIVVFIDPIDGTNSFVQGEPDVPMQLLGITYQTVPVAGVTNRVFAPVVHPKVPGSSLSLGCCGFSSSSSSSSSFLVLSGRQLHLPGGSHASTVNLNTESTSAVRAVERAPSLVVTYSSSTKPALMDHWMGWLRSQNQGPMITENMSNASMPVASTRNSNNNNTNRGATVTTLAAPGAGHKLMLVVNRAAVAVAPHTAIEGIEGAAADLFLSPIASVKAWDTVGPHALLRALGGDLFHLPTTTTTTTAAASSFALVRYPLFRYPSPPLPTTMTSASATARSACNVVVDKKRSTTFPGGIIAVAPTAMHLFQSSSPLCEHHELPRSSSSVQAKL